MIEYSLLNLDDLTFYVLLMGLRQRTGTTINRFGRSVNLSARRRRKRTNDKTLTSTWQIHHTVEIIVAKYKLLPTFIKLKVPEE